jgi:hypothetical protein
LRYVALVAGVVSWRTKPWVPTMRIVLAVIAIASGDTLHAAWTTRRGGRASPVLLVALYGDQAALCGPAGDDPPVRTGIRSGSG